jgi:Zn-finger nucleic acid-binding protein
MARTEITRSLFGYRVGYDCPKCGERLRSSLNDAGKVDDCPNCHSRFTVPGSEELQAIRARQQAALDRKVESARQQRAEEEKLKREAAEAKEVARRDAERRNAEQLERELAEQRGACSVCGAKVEPGKEKCAKCTQPVSGKNVSRISFAGATLALIAVVGAYFAYPWIRDSGLREKLAACESHDVIAARVTYDGILSTETVVFDVVDGGSPSARRIDSVHLLMEFAGKLDLYSVKRIILARNGTEKFYISGSDMRPLASSYAGGGRVWAFNHLPENIRTMSGQRAYNEWSGGWIGVLQKQSEDVNDLIKQWTGY